MKKTSKKLSLSRETLRNLNRAELGVAAGGAGTGACTYSGCGGGGCTTDTTATYSKVQGHCPSTIAA
jgi:hypothetical protein